RGTGAEPGRIRFDVPGGADGGARTAGGGGDHRGHRREQHADPVGHRPAPGRGPAAGPWVHPAVDVAHDHDRIAAHDRHRPGRRGRRGYVLRLCWHHYTLTTKFMTLSLNCLSTTSPSETEPVCV